MQDHMVVYSSLFGPGCRASLFFFFNGEMEHIRLESALKVWSLAHFVLQNEECSNKTQARENRKALVLHSESPLSLGEVEEQVSE